jgi:hypothetical protein
VLTCPSAAELYCQQQAAVMWHQQQCQVAAANAQQLARAVRVSRVEADLVRPAGPEQQQQQRSQLLQPFVSRPYAPGASALPVIHDTSCASMEGL